MLKQIMIGMVALAFAWRAEAANLGSLRRSVFKINVVSSEPSFTDPWKKNQASSSSGTGFYIGDGRILTNAHVVANATFITVLRDRDSKPVPAYVKFIAHDADLAILQTKNKKIFDDVEALSFGKLPRLRAAVATIGFPAGGEQLSITEGIVSRVEYRRYVHHGSASHLLVQVDSAINPGNSGGPVVQGREVVGVAFQSYTRAENTGYIIPTPVITRFLKDVEDGKYDGHPDDGLTTSEWTMLNPSTVAFHGLKPDDGGVKLNHVASWCTANNLLKAGDILLAVDGSPIGADGKISYHGERVDFRVVFDLKQVGERVRYKVVRGRGNSFDVEVPVGDGAPHPRPEHVYARSSKYFVWGGLVFTTLSRSYLRTWGERWYRDAPLLLRFLDSYGTIEPEADGLEDVVVLAKRLPDAVNAYATQNIYSVVSQIDGERVTSLKQFSERLEKGSGEFAIIRFMGSDELTVISRPKVAQRNAAINSRYGVVPDRWLAGAELDGATAGDANDSDKD